MKESIKCPECNFFKNGCSAYEIAKNVYGRNIPPPPIGACTIAIVESYVKHIKGGMVVLEIGCGSWSGIKDICDRVGAEYQAIDMQEEYLGNKTIATRIEPLQKLSFDNDMFDLVIGNQTIEHWGENGCSLREGLSQIMRVTKVGGKVFLNAPIHFHGTSLFLLGKLDKIENLIKKFTNTYKIIRWSGDSEKVKKFYTYKNYWPLINKPAYMIDIQIVKTFSLPHKKVKLKLPILISRQLNYPRSFIIFKILNKLKILSDLNQEKK